MTEKKLAIVVPVWNQWAYTKRAIIDLAAMPDNHLLVIVDNGSTDGNSQLRSGNRMEIVRHTSNLGFSKGSNSGFARAVELEYENVMFLNNDIRVFAEGKDAETWTAPLIQAAQDGYIAGPTAGCLDEQFNFICEASKLPVRGYGYLSGWNITASTKTWQKLILEGDAGPFNTRFISYFEDTDLSMRALKMGIELKIVDVPVRHIGKVTGKKAGLSALYTKSRKTFIELWSPVHN
jgi:GT2 family glycosyltransferase